MNEVRIRPATPSDAAPLSLFAAEVFRATFEAKNDPADLERYLTDSFSPEKQVAEIADARFITLLAETPRGFAGYAQLCAGALPTCVTAMLPLEMKRLYVSPAQHGRGVAAQLMGAVIEAARAAGAKSLWLGVWERNPRAIAFYRKHGFERVGEHVFQLGADAQTDWIMQRDLSCR